MADNSRCPHGNRICSVCVVVSDAAKRCADIINAYATFVPFEHRVRCWVAIRLSDGGSDGTLYESRRDAVRHQSDEKLCAYFTYRNSPHGMKPKDAQLWLDYHRAAYDAGFRLPDPDHQTGGPDLIMPLPWEQFALQRRRLIGPGMN